MEFSSKRARRVVEAFISCVKSGEYTYEYACLLIEDNEKYGYLTTSDKDIFYDTLDLFFTKLSEENTDAEEINNEQY